MSLILEHPRSRQPQAFARLARGYEDARFIYNPGTWWALDVSRQNFGAAASGLGADSVAPQAGGFRGLTIASSGGSANYLEWASRADFDVPASGYSMFVYAKRLGNSSANYDRLFTRDISATNPNNSFGFLLTPSTDGNPHRVYFQNKNGTTATNIGIVAAAPQASTSDFWLYLLSHDGTTARMFVNGTLVDSQTCTPPAASSLVLRLGRSTGGANTGAPLVVALAGILPRSVPEQEARRLSENPWQIFAPIPRRIWKPAVVASVPTLLDSTYKPGTLTADGWQPRVTAS